MSIATSMARIAIGAALLASTAPTPVSVPFDFSKHEIGVDVTIKGASLYVIVDTGVDPSIIDLSRAQTLGLKVDRSDAGEASGFGDGRGATVYPATIAGLAIRGHRFAPFDALASDLAGLSNHYGRPIDAVLGYSFLSNKIILVDYPQRTLAITASVAAAGPLVRGCRARWSVPLATADGFPVLSGFRIGHDVGPVSLDTGSNGGIALFGRALDIPGVRGSMVAAGTHLHHGARGEEKTGVYTLTVPVGFGPFTLPAGQVISVHTGVSPGDGRIANIGNTLFAAMKIKMLLDYPGRTMTFYGDCI